MYKYIGFRLLPLFLLNFFYLYFDKFSEKNSKKTTKNPKKCIFDILALFLAFSTSFQKNLNFQRYFKCVQLLTRGKNILGKKKKTLNLNIFPSLQTAGPSLGEQETTAAPLFWVKKEKNRENGDLLSAMAVSPYFLSSSPNLPLSLIFAKQTRGHKTASFPLVPPVPFRHPRPFQPPLAAALTPGHFRTSPFPLQSLQPPLTRQRNLPASTDLPTA